jgi:hypothetical protein
MKFQIRKKDPATQYLNYSIQALLACPTLLFENLTFAGNLELEERTKEAVRKIRKKKIKYQ